MLWLRRVDIWTMGSLAEYGRGLAQRTPAQQRPLGTIDIYHEAHSGGRIWQP